jgi:hypothetical protein
MSDSGPGCRPADAQQLETTTPAAAAKQSGHDADHGVGDRSPRLVATDEQQNLYSQGAVGGERSAETDSSEQARAQPPADVGAAPRERFQQHAEQKGAADVDRERGRGPAAATDRQQLGDQLAYRRPDDAAQGHQQQRLWRHR